MDAGNDATCLLTDQRGVTRPKGTHCDIGAFEVADRAITVDDDYTAGTDGWSGDPGCAAGQVPLNTDRVCTAPLPWQNRNTSSTCR